MCATPPASTACLTLVYSCHARLISPPASHRASPCPAVRIRFQPTACLERLKRHQHGVHVPSVQRRLPTHCLPDATPAMLDPSRLPLPATHFPAWQRAHSFNQPLAWDVSSVTNMAHMFYVRSVPSLCTTCPLAMQDLSRHLLPTAPYLARQHADRFNQPLAWDVSSVTSMNGMFQVRSAACLHTACPTPDLPR